MLKMIIRYDFPLKIAKRVNLFDYSLEELQTIFYKGIMPSEKGFRFSSGL